MIGDDHVPFRGSLGLSEIPRGDSTSGVCGLTGLAAVPAAFGLIRRRPKAPAVAAAQPREPVMSAPRRSGAFGESDGQAGAHGAPGAG